MANLLRGALDGIKSRDIPFILLREVVKSNTQKNSHRWCQTCTESICILTLSHDAYLIPLYRRNELLLANKPTIIRQAAAAAGPEEEKIKKFATAIVEFSKVKRRKDNCSIL